MQELKIPLWPQDLGSRQDQSKTSQIVKKMSQPEKPQVTTYSDKTSMGSGNGGNGRNGGPAVPLLPPPPPEQSMTVLVPQAPQQITTTAQGPMAPLAPFTEGSQMLFGGQRIFLHAPQYHWHPQPVTGTDEEARKYSAELAQRMFTFGQRTEEREIQLWRKMEQALMVSEVDQILDKV